MTWMTENLHRQKDEQLKQGETHRDGVTDRESQTVWPSLSPFLLRKQVLAIETDTTVELWAVGKEVLWFVVAETGAVPRQQVPKRITWGQK